MPLTLNINGILNPVVLFLPRVLAALAILLVFWLLSITLGKVIGRLVQVKSVDQALVDLLGRIARVGLLAIGVITACGTLGIDVTALVTGLGLTGFALGFALKDIISNALSGILILIYKPFRRGDRISLTGFEGAVTEINLRYTILDGGTQRIFIPNSNLFSNPLVVLTDKGASAVKPGPGSTIFSPPDAEETMIQEKSPFG